MSHYKKFRILCVNFNRNRKKTCDNDYLKKYLKFFIENLALKFITKKNIFPIKLNDDYVNIDVIN